MTEEQLSEFIRGVNPKVYYILVIAGGEPSLAPSLLRIAIDGCREMGMLSSIVTAPIWGKSISTAVSFLNRIPRPDLITLSYDNYHLEFLDIAHYENATIAASERGIRVTLNVCQSGDDEKRELLDRIEHFRHKISAIAFQTTLPVGNGSHAENIPREGIRIDTKDDLFRLSTSCVVGDAFVDLPLRGAHACCWAASVDDSPLSYGTEDQQDSVEALPLMLDDPTFEAIRRRGLLGLLDPENVDPLFELVKGETIVNECHLCLIAMRKENRGAWTSCVQRRAVERMA